jgi:hypothetical protein
MIRAALAASLLLSLVTTAPLHPQGWGLDLYAGRALYDAVSASIPATNLVAGIRHSGAAPDWLYLAAAAPLGDDAPWWAAAGGSRRLLAAGTRAGSGAGLDLAAHGYLFRDAVALQTGTGGTLEPRLFAALAQDGARLELSGGWLHHSSSFAGHVVNRDAFAAGFLLAVDLYVSMQTGIRVVSTREGSYPEAHALLSARTGPVSLWASAERWLDTELDDAGWGAGASASLGFAEAWASYRQETRDPLYWNAARRSWSVGLSRSLGRPTPARQLVRPLERGGRAVVRLPVTAARGAVYVAGDFTDWQPRPMQQAAGHWEMELDLAPGVYRYSFVDAAGRWFVPETVAGRIADGMGGHVAVLVVP